MSRTFYHDLNVVIPCSFRQLTQANQFFDLTNIGSISQTSRTTCVSQGNGHIVFLTDIKDLVIMFIERIFLASHAHPGKYQASAAADDIHLSLVFLDLFDGFLCDPAVKRNKIHAIFCVHSYHIYKILCRQSCQISLVMDHTVIDRNSPDHNRTFAGQLATKRLGISMAGKIHDGLRAQIYRAHHFFHFYIVILAVTGNTQIDVDLGAKHAAYALCAQAGVIFIGTDRNFTLCHQLHQLVFIHVFFLRHRLDFRCQDPFSCCIHLRRIVSHLFCLHSFFT